MGRTRQKDKKSRKNAIFGLTNIEIEEVKSKCKDTTVDELRKKLTEGALENSFMSMNLGDLSLFTITKEKEQSQDPITNVILGSEVPLELPDTFTEHDRMVITRTRNTRRNAIHVEDGKKLKSVLNTYLTSKNLNGFLTIGYNQLRYIDIHNELEVF